MILFEATLGENSRRTVYVDLSTLVLTVKSQCISKLVSPLLVVVRTSIFRDVRIFVSCFLEVLLQESVALKTSEVRFL